MTNPLSRLRRSAGPLLWGTASIVLLLFASAMCSVVAMAAVVSLQPPPPNEAMLRIPVVLTGEFDEELAGVQFDLNYDTTQYTLEAIESGAAASDAGKEVILSEPSPGQGRVLITGFNTNTLFDGHVATLLLRPRTPDAAAHTLAVDNLLATDPFGNTISLDYGNDYDYPPLPPEKTEASLSEAATENAGDVEAAPDTTASEANTPETDQFSLGNTDAQNATVSGYGGGVATPLNSPTKTSTAKHNIQERAAPYRVQKRFDNSVSATVPTHSVAGRSAPRGPRTQVAARNRNTTSARTARPSPRDTVTDTTEEPLSDGPATPYRRLALAIPTASITGSSEAQSNAAAVLSDKTSLSRPRGHNEPTAIVLFLVFFVGFAALHIKVFRWLSGSNGRRRA